MDDGGHRENGRHKADQFKAAQNQWLMQHQPSMKHIVAIMAERDAALQERNLAISEKKAALAERDMAMLQRDAAIQERNTAIMERDNAIATLQYRDSTMNGDNVSTPPQGCQVTRGMKHMHHTQSEVPYGSRDIHIPDALSICPAISDPLKPRKVKRNKETKTASFGKKGSRLARKQEEEEMGGDDLNKQLALSRPEWKTQDLGLNQVAFDDSTMPPPVCSCTGTLRQCYKWGNGGWQSSCCTTTISVYPLPNVPNKRHARIGGRKMSGSAFNKLLSRLASEGHDLVTSVDLKDHWARHGTNRYITIK